MPDIINKNPNNAQRVQIDNSRPVPVELPPEFKQLLLGLNRSIQEFSIQLKSQELQQKQDEQLATLYSQYKDDPIKLQYEIQKVITPLQNEIQKQLALVQQSFQQQQLLLEQQKAQFEEQKRIRESIESPELNTENIVEKLRYAVNMYDPRSMAVAPLLLNDMEYADYFSDYSFDRDFMRLQRLHKHVTGILQRSPGMFQNKLSEEYKLGGEYIDELSEFQRRYQAAILHKTLTKNLNITHIDREDFENTALPALQDLAQTLNLTIDTTSKLLKKFRDLKVITADISTGDSFEILKAVDQVEEVFKKVNLVFGSRTVQETLQVINNINRMTGGDFRLLYSELDKVPSEYKPQIIQAIKTGSLSNLNQVRTLGYQLSYRDLLGYIEPETYEESAAYRMFGPSGILSLADTVRKNMYAFDINTAVKLANKSPAAALTYIQTTQFRQPEDVFIDAFDQYKRETGASDEEIAIALSGGNMTVANAILMARKAAQKRRQEGLEFYSNLRKYNQSLTRISSDFETKYDLTLKTVKGLVGALSTYQNLEEATGGIVDLLPIIGDIKDLLTTGAGAAVYYGNPREYIQKQIQKELNVYSGAPEEDIYAFNENLMTPIYREIEEKFKVEKTLENIKLTEDLIMGVDSIVQQILHSEEFLNLADAFFKVEPDTISLRFFFAQFLTAMILLRQKGKINQNEFDKVRKMIENDPKAVLHVIKRVISPNDPLKNIIDVLLMKATGHLGQNAIVATSDVFGKTLMSYKHRVNYIQAQSDAAVIGRVIGAGIGTLVGAGISYTTGGLGTGVGIVAGTALTAFTSYLTSKAMAPAVQYVEEKYEQVKEDWELLNSDLIKEESRKEIFFGKFLGNTKAERELSMTLAVGISYFKDGVEFKLEQYDNEQVWIDIFSKIFIITKKFIQGLEVQKIKKEDRAHYANDLGIQLVNLILNKYIKGHTDRFNLKDEEPIVMYLHMFARGVLVETSDLYSLIKNTSTAALREYIRNTLQRDSIEILVGSGLFESVSEELVSGYSKWIGTSERGAFLRMLENVKKQHGEAAKNILAEFATAQQAYSYRTVGAEAAKNLRQLGSLLESYNIEKFQNIESYEKQEEMLTELSEILDKGDLSKENLEKAIDILTKASGDQSVKQILSATGINVDALMTELKRAQSEEEKLNIVSKYLVQAANQEAKKIASEGMLSMQKITAYKEIVKQILSDPDIKQLINDVT